MGVESRNRTVMEIVKLEVGKYYSMKVTRSISRIALENRIALDHIGARLSGLKPDVSGIVFFKVEKLIKDKNSVHYEVWSEDRITIERNHTTLSCKIGTWTGKRILPKNIILYKYNEIAEITENDFKRRIKYSSYGL